MVRKWDDIMQEWYTAKDIEPQTNKSYKSINRYINDFKQHLKIKKLGNIIHVDKESMEIIKKVCAMYDNGLTTLQIKHKLKEQGTQTIIDMPSDENDGNTTGVNLAEALVGVKREMQEQREINEKLVEAVKHLNERIIQQDKTIKESLEYRDKTIVERMRLSLEEQKRLSIESTNHKENEMKEKLEGINKQLEKIQSQQTENRETDYKTTEKQFEALTNELHEMRRTIAEVASSNEKKRWWQKFFS